MRGGGDEVGEFLLGLRIFNLSLKDSSKNARLFIDTFSIFVNLNQELNCR